MITISEWFYSCNYDLFKEYIRSYLLVYLSDFQRIYNVLSIKGSKNYCINTFDKETERLKNKNKDPFIKKSLTYLGPD